jgi:hypothetical protein
MMPLENSLKSKKPVTGMKKWLGPCLGMVLLTIAGCAGESALERDYGNAWVFNQAVQLANPQAGLVATPAVGLSPKASSNVMDAYNKSFTGSKSGGGSQTTINLGGLTTAGGGSSGGGN